MCFQVLGGWGKHIWISRAGNSPVHDYLGQNSLLKIAQLNVSYFFFLTATMVSLPSQQLSLVPTPTITALSSSEQRSVTVILVKHTCFPLLQTQQVSTLSVNKIYSACTQMLINDKLEI